MVFVLAHSGAFRTMSLLKNVKLLISLFTFVVTALLVQAPVNARGLTQYEAWKVGKPGGYREKVKGPNRWYVNGTSSGSARQGISVGIAIHRVAIRAKAAGFSHFSIVKFQIFMAYKVKSSDVEQDAYITAVGINDPSNPAPCEAIRGWERNCKTLSVDETLALHGPLLGQTPDMQAEELARLKAGAG